MGPGPEYFPGNPGNLYPFSGKSLEKIVQKKDSGNDPQVARVARYLPGPVPCVPHNCQTACDHRFRVGPLREGGQPPGFSGMGGDRAFRYWSS
ncbi:MAG: hypothetical protein CVV30_11805 [Methanomicrobiales archaeon HGW-Methanomicrobiales-1]|nr:MAG: hypothetical protein CVV30_11805 [Methanomicrobiales archaeon HGW-Methanomicrobiales-1]